jgi:AcrR family transcriptional regulator
MKKLSKSIQPRYDVEGRYQALLEAGEALLCRGYDRAKPQLIAQTAGVSVGLFYRHFQNKQELLTAIMIGHLKTLHHQIQQETELYSNPGEQLDRLIVLTLRYFESHQGLIKLFFMQIGYGNEVATEQLQEVRQTYRNILQTILKTGSDRGYFINNLDIQIAINSIIGTINWTLYDLLIVNNGNLKSDELAKKLSNHLLRSLTV